MLSRAAVLLKTKRSCGTTLPSIFLKRVCSTSQKAISIMDMPNPPVIPKDGPERDLVNFPRPKHEMHGGKVRIAFVPEEWFQFFYKKTGVTGPYLFGAGLITFLMSKEYFVINHEFHNGISLFIVIVFIVKKFGPKVAAYLDKECEADIQSDYEFKKHSMEVFATGIAKEKEQQAQVETQKIIFDAKRENVLLQLEAEYRHRAMQVYEAFKKRLDYQVRVNESTKNIQHKHMVDWIVNNVIKNITPQQEADALKKCIADLKLLSASAR